MRVSPLFQTNEFHFWWDRSAWTAFVEIKDVQSRKSRWCQGLPRFLSIAGYFPIDRLINHRTAVFEVLENFFSGWSKSNSHQKKTKTFYGEKIDTRKRDRRNCFDSSTETDSALRKFPSRLLLVLLHISASLCWCRLAPYCCFVVREPAQQFINVLPSLVFVRKSAKQRRNKRSLLDLGLHCLWAFARALDSIY